MEENRVDVIAVFDKEGNIRPLYVKLQGHDSVKVEKVYKIGNAPFAGSGNILEYDCGYVVDDTMRKFCLYYHVHEHCWTVPESRTDTADWA